MKAPFKSILPLTLTVAVYASLLFTHVPGLGVGTLLAKDKKNHPDGWASAHGKEYYTKRDECKACHGDDLAGGATGVPCDMCHISPKHPANWTDTHGAEYTKTKDGCDKCHGTDLMGGGSQIACNMCHLSPRHEKNWLENHGVNFLKDKKSCVGCHGKPLFSELNKPSNTSCTKCHVSQQDQSLLAPESHSSRFSINFEQRAQMREDKNSHQKFLSNHYFGVHYAQNQKQVTFDSQFGFDREWLNGTQNNFDVYEAFFRFENIFDAPVTLGLGRQAFLSHIDYFLVDGVSVLANPAKWFDLSLYAGVPRFIESEDLTGDLGFAAGVTWALKETHYTNARVSLDYQKKDFDHNTLNDTDKLYLSLAASKGVSIFKFYTQGEYDLSDTLPVSATVGSEIYPFAKKIGFLVEGNYYNESRNDNLDTIFKVFSMDELWQLKSGLFINVIRNLSFQQDFSFQRYSVLSGVSKKWVQCRDEFGLQLRQDWSRVACGLLFCP